MASERDRQPIGVNPFEASMMRVLDEHLELIGALTVQVKRLTTTVEAHQRYIDSRITGVPFEPIAQEAVSPKEQTPHA